MPFNFLTSLRNSSFVWALRLSQKRTNSLFVSDVFITAGLRVLVTQLTLKFTSAQAFACQYTSTSSWYAFFSSVLTRFPVPRKIMPILTGGPFGAKQICNVHCRLSSPGPGVLTQARCCRCSPRGSFLSYVVFESIVNGIGTWSTLKRLLGRNLPHLLS